MAQSKQTQSEFPGSIIALLQIGKSIACASNTAIHAFIRQFSIISEVSCLLMQTYITTCIHSSRCHMFSCTSRQSRWNSNAVMFAVTLITLADVSGSSLKHAPRLKAYVFFLDASRTTRTHLVTVLTLQVVRKIREIWLTIGKSEGWTVFCFIPAPQLRS